MIQVRLHCYPSTFTSSLILSLESLQVRARTKICQLQYVIELATNPCNPQAREPSVSDPDPQRFGSPGSGSKSEAMKLTKV
jgi:hypothetical protein